MYDDTSLRKPWMSVKKFRTQIYVRLGKQTQYHITPLSTSIPDEALCAIYYRNGGLKRVDKVVQR